MAADDRFRVTPRLIGGLAVAAVGLLLLLDRLDLMDAEAYLEWWPLALVAIGILHLTQPREGGRRFVGLIWIVAGAWLLLNSLDLLDLQIWDAFWPLILIALGGALAWRALRGPVARTPGAPDVDTISAVAILGGTKRASSSAAFRGGELTAVMGGCEIDLRQARIAEGGEAVIDTLAFWGGIEIKVPESWAVVGKVVPLLGAFEDKTRPPQAGAPPRLVVRGMAIMGGVDVSN
jgi:cell wall-active antibiotic response 4TMS protein YvqF